MNEDDLKRELAILLAHFIRNKQPDVYKKLATFCNEKKLFPPFCSSVEEALDLRYENFPPNHFNDFIKSLLPKDDFPSIFRRITPFRTTTPILPFRTINPIKRIFCHTDPIYCLSMDPLGRILATGADDSKIKLWTLPDLDPICTLNGHENCVTNVCFNPLCTLLLSSSHDKTIRIWSLVDGSCMAVLCDFTTNFVHSAVFSPSGSMIAAACEDGTIPIWVTRDALQSLGPCRILNTIGKGPAAWVAFSPGGEFISYTCEPAVVVVIALKTMATFQLDRLHSSLVGLTSFTSMYFINGVDAAPRLITASNEEGIAAVWEFSMENFNYKPKHIFKHTGYGRRSTKIQQLAWDCDEHLLVIAKTNAVLVCDTYTGEIVGTLPNCAALEECTCIAPNPVYREVFFFGNSSGHVAIADVCKNEILTVMKCAEDTGFLDAVWSKDGQWIFACDSLGSISTFCTFGPNDSLRKGNPDFVFTDCFDDENQPGIYIDRDNQTLDPQPRKRDIRSLDLELLTLQASYLRNCAIELGLIQRMAAPDRQTISTSQSAIIGPPPLHVHISLECPVNPKGNPHISGQESSVPMDEEVPQPTIISDTDDWEFIDEESFHSVVDTNEYSKSLLILSEDIPPGFWPDWACAIACDDNLFIPQAGDDVVLIWSAYQKMLNESGRANVKKPEKISEITRCIVQQFTGNHKGMELKLSNALMSNPLTVHFPIPEEVTFLIPLQKFKVSKRVIKNLKINDKIVVPFVSEDGGIAPYTGNIIEISSKWKAAPFEAIKVDWGNGEISNISPWEILYLNGEEIKFIDKTLRVEGIETGMLAAVDALENEPKYESFVSCLDSDKLPNYLKVVSMPMTLKFLRERLESGYYRSVDSIIFDIQLIYSNAVVFNEPSSTVIGAAKDLLNNLKRTLDILSKQHREKRQPKKK